MAEIKYLVAVVYPKYNFGVVL